MYTGQISIYGMNDKLGNLSFPPEQNDGGIQTFRPYSEKTAELIDEEAMVLVKKAYNDTLDLLGKYKDKVADLAKTLMEKETIGHEDIVVVLGERPFKNDAYKAYLENTKNWEEKYSDDIIDGHLNAKEENVDSENVDKNGSENAEETMENSSEQIENENINENEDNVNESKEESK